MAIAAAVASAAVWLHPGIGHDPTSVAPSNAQPVVTADLAALLQQVHVIDYMPKVDGYERGCGKGEACVFGPAWNDPLSRSHCDTRNRLLQTQLREIAFKPGTKKCKVISGYLDPDPYTGMRTELNRIEADHVVPLHRAWDAGAWRWSPQQRQIFATDMIELIAVSGKANREKSDSGLDEWLPDYQPCTYIQRYLTVAVKYQLPITVSERQTVTRTCLR